MVRNLYYVDYEMISLFRKILGRLNKGFLMKMEGMIIAIVILIVLPATVMAENCANPSGKFETEHCLSLEVDQSNSKLNAIYGSLLKKLERPDTETDHYSSIRRELILTQRAWVKFKELDCRLVYTTLSAYSMRGFSALECEKNRADQRIKELNDLIELQQFE